VALGEAVIVGDRLEGLTRPQPAVALLVGNAGLCFQQSAAKGDGLR